MKNQITMTQMMQATKILHAQGKHFTHIGVGPMSHNLLRAASECLIALAAAESARPRKVAPCVSAYRTRLAVLLLHGHLNPCPLDDLSFQRRGQSKSSFMCCVHN